MKGTATTATADYDYEAAFQVIARVQRAAADPEYAAAAFAAYRDVFGAEMAVKFAVAVEEQRRFAAEQNEPAGSAA